MSIFALASLFVAQRTGVVGPGAFLHYAPDRTCDLINIAVDVEVDYKGKTVKGHVVNTMSPLRNGLTQVHLMAAAPVIIGSVSVDGSSAHFTQTGDDLAIDTAPLTKGKSIQIAIDYKIANANGGGFGSGRGGWHWIVERDGQPNHVGFWTQGEAEYARQWVPTWDYPNDLATSETRCTVPADWTVIGNGVMVSNKLSADGKARTYDWKSTIPHATYLLTLCGGPFDVKKDKWEGVDLWYVVPKGEGDLIEDSFGDTKDMLSFYSKVLGYKYPWPKYAQDAMFDFGGGMENASATTLQESALTDKRDGFRRMASLNSHELGHQWFGDTVTCKDWGDIFLNESFATYMQMIYFEHSRGRNGYDREIDNNTRSYLAESRRYKRPISTKFYTNGEAMFDSHTYPKGGVVLHTLRRFLGDENFYAGLSLYLHTWQHTPVQSAQLCRAMTEATGINCEPFWDQWFLKPGHPVLDYTWTYDAGSVKLHVSQSQSTADGTPIYKIPGKVGLISGTTFREVPVTLDGADQTITIPLSAKPDALILDPDHDYLREIPTLHWAASELPFILKSAPSCLERNEAMRQMMAVENPSDEAIRQVAEAFRADKELIPIFPSIRILISKARAELRPMYLEMLNHPDFQRRADAIDALAALPADPATTTAVKALITQDAPIVVSVNAINALARWDLKGNLEVYKKALTITDRRNAVKSAAQRAIDRANGTG